MCVQGGAEVALAVAAAVAANAASAQHGWYCY